MIEFKQVSLMFDDPTNQRSYTALNDINLMIEKGKIYSIIGENGSGKSTLLKLIAGLIIPTTGQITINNDLISEQRLSYLDKISYCPQQADSAFFNKTVDAELRFSQKEEATIAHFIDTYQLAPLLELSPFQLSSGQKKKLLFALATITEPDILILDEITAGLDTSSKQLILNDINQSKSHRYTIMVSHDLATSLAFSDHIIFIHQRHILFSGHPQVFLKSPHILEETGFSLPDIYQIQEALKIKELIPTVTTTPTPTIIANQLIKTWRKAHV